MIIKPFYLIGYMEFGEHADHVCRILNKNGKDCYFVGGCVRDKLMGATPKDIDVTTDAAPDEVKRLFNAEGCTIYGLGEKFGTIAVRCNPDEKFIEITTYRTESGGYEKARRPKNVCFTAAFKDDASRRDFTINAIAYDPIKKELVDCVGGQADIKAKTVRAIGDADKRFQEDAIRIIRACRFKNKLGFDIEPETFEAMKRNKENVRNLSGERVRDELLNIMSYDKPSVGMNCLRDAGVHDVILPEVSALQGIKQNEKYHKYDAYDHTMAVVDNLPKDKPLHRMAGLLHDIGKAKVKQDEQ